MIVFSQFRFASLIGGTVETTNLYTPLRHCFLPRNQLMFLPETQEFFVWQVKHDRSVPPYFFEI